ncbi:MAG: class I SAM-dependent methyltransferase [Candidatus Abyssobacteria bacterium SURF_17]|jgi:SAM-dependent methyltransferase|uniref:Class I SAM-dependent methyltransferase n=1 Tax=Candidatus Abyssobacteria bacterium SURF_17 TaxID=2093361 RepID=A0A419F2Q8_9BACT|nr:MAG: class I SAM-dependent methyltransferase [Candidatus Abyssubacteria bacterium SURF_17]
MENKASTTVLSLKCFTEYFYSPALAMWRAEEAQLFAALELEGPVLDLGCGDGTFADMIFGKRAHIGVDLSLNNVRKAKRLDTYGSLANADARLLPFKNGAFSAVIGNCVLEHIHGIEQTLQEIARVLRPGGLLVFTVPSEFFSDNLWLTSVLNHVRMPRMARRYAAAKNRRLVHVNVLSEADWAWILTQNGLATVRIERYMSASTTRMFGLLHDVFDIGVGRYNLANGLKQVAVPLRRLGIDKALASTMARALRSHNGNGSEAASGLFIVARKMGEKE